MLFDCFKIQPFLHTLVHFLSHSVLTQTWNYTFKNYNKIEPQVNNSALQTKSNKRNCRVLKWANRQSLNRMKRKISDVSCLLSHVECRALNEHIQPNSYFSALSRFDHSFCFWFLSASPNVDPANQFYPYLHYLNIILVCVVFLQELLELSLNIKIACQNFTNFYSYFFNSRKKT